MERRTCARPTAGDHRRGRRHRQRRRPAQPAATSPTCRAPATFAGPAFHSARWDHEVDLARQAGRRHRHGRQRRPVHPRDRRAGRATSRSSSARRPGSSPRPTTATTSSPRWRGCCSNVPGYTNWLRFWNFWQNVEGLMVAARVDPEWDNGGPSVSQVNELDPAALRPAPPSGAGRPARPAPVGHARLPAVLEAVHPRRRRLGAHDHARRRRPRHEPRSPRSPRRACAPRTACCTRPTSSSTAPASPRPTSSCRCASSGATASSSTTGGRATLGRTSAITLPGFPNLFLLYGPEHEHRRQRQHHLLLRVRGALRGRLHRGAPARGGQGAGAQGRRCTTPSTSEVDAENLRMAWGVSTVNTWYKNATGRTAQNWPFSLREYWQRTRDPGPRTDLRSTVLRVTDWLRTGRAT